MNDISNSLHAGPRESAFISLARLLMVFALVWHHLYELPGSGVAPRGEFLAPDHFLPEFLNSFTHMAFMGAIPLLSLLAGYLFCRQRSRGFPLLVRREFYSILLPSWLWAALALGLAWVLYRLPLPEAAFAWADYGFAEPGPMTLVNGIFGHTQVPFAIQFWFVHDLALTLVLAPLLLYALRVFGGLVPLVLLSLWLLLPSFPLFFYSHMPAFFTLGAWLAYTSADGLDTTLDRLQGYTVMCVVLFATALFARVMAPYFGDWRPALNSYAFLCLIRLLGMLSFALLIQRFSRRSGRLRDWLLRHRGDAFFIFALHFPLIELYQSAVGFIPGHDTAWGLTLSWLLVPLLTIATALGLARGLARLLPGLYRLLDGRWVPQPRSRKEGRGMARPYTLPGT